MLNGGAINYNFASSSNAGTTWSSWLPLSNANLQNMFVWVMAKTL